MDPRDPAVPAEHPVLGLVRSPPLHRLVPRVDHRRPVRGMQEAPPDRRLSHPLLGRAAKQRLDLRTDVGGGEPGGAGGVGRLDPRDHREAFDQGPVPGLGLAEPRVRQLAVGHVADHDLDRRLPLVGQRAGRHLDVDRRAVDADEPLLDAGDGPSLLPYLADPFDHHGT